MTIAHPRRTGPNSRSGRAVLIVLACLVLLGALLAPVLAMAVHSAGAVFAFFALLFAPMIGGGALLAIWGGLGGGSAVFRAALSLGLTVVNVLVLIGGCRLAEAVLPTTQHLSRQDLYIISAVAGGVYATTFLASVGWSLLTGCSLRRADDAPRAGAFRFSLAQMLTWTTLVAIVLGVARWVAPPEFQFRSVGVVFGFFAMCGAISLAVALPSLAIVFIEMMAARVAAASWWLFTLPGAVLVSRWFDAGPLEHAAAAYVGALLFTTPPLLAARAVGYRLLPNDQATAPDASRSTLPSPFAPGEIPRDSTEATGP